MKKNNQHLHKSYKKFYIISFLIIISLSISSFFIFDFSLEHTFLFEKLYNQFLNKNNIIATENIELDTQNIEIFDPILEESEAINQEYLNNSIFIGDNKLLEISSLGILPSTNIFLINELSIDKIESGFFNPDSNTHQTLETIISNNKPKYYYILLGNDSISNFDTSSFYMYYNALIEEIQNMDTDSKIVLVPIFPVSYSFSNIYLPPDITIPKINEEILNIATKYTAYYLDYYNILSNNDGYILDEYISENSNTLTSEAYGLFLDYLKTHPVK